MNLLRLLVGWFVQENWTKPLSSGAGGLAERDLLSLEQTVALETPDGRRSYSGPADFVEREILPMGSSVLFSRHVEGMRGAGRAGGRGRRISGGAPSAGSAHPHRVSGTAHGGSGRLGGGVVWRLQDGSEGSLHTHCYPRESAPDQFHISLLYRPGHYDLLYSKSGAPSLPLPSLPFPPLSFLTYGMSLMQTSPKWSAIHAQTIGHSIVQLLYE